MIKETMSVHKALSELKTLDKRIHDAIVGCRFVGVTKKAAQMVGSQSVSDFTADEKSRYQTATDLIKRRNAIKRGVVLSNATTKVVVAEKEYTVAEAIEMKNHGMEGRYALRSAMAESLRRAESNIELIINKIDRDADTYVQSVFNGKDAKADDVNRVRASYCEGQAVELVDPMNIREELKMLDDEINAFVVEIDSALSVSNATTNIEIEY